jgi:hypothetical protein
MQVGLSINSMSVCGLIHAAVMKTGKLYVAESEEAEFMRLARQFALRCAGGAFFEPCPLKSLAPFQVAVEAPALPAPGMLYN